MLLSVYDNVLFCTPSRASKRIQVKKKKDYYYLVLPTISLKQAKGSVTLVVTSGETEPRKCPRKEVVGNA